MTGTCGKGILTKSSIGCDPDCAPWWMAVPGATGFGCSGSFGCFVGFGFGSDNCCLGLLL